MQPLISGKAALKAAISFDFLRGSFWPMLTGLQKFLFQYKSLQTNVFWHVYYRLLSRPFLLFVLIQIPNFKVIFWQFLGQFSTCTEEHGIKAILAHYYYIFITNLKKDTFSTPVLFIFLVIIFLHVVRIMVFLYLLVILPRLLRQTQTDRLHLNHLKGSPCYTTVLSTNNDLKMLCCHKKSTHDKQN